MSVMDYARMFLYTLRSSIRARVPEKVILVAIYISDFFLLLTHTILRSQITEATPLLIGVDVVVALENLLPFFMFDLVPLYHYLILVALLVYGSVMGLLSTYPLFYYLVALISVLTVLKVEPALPTHPVVMRIVMSTKKAIKRGVDKEHLELSIRLAFVHIGGIIVSGTIFALTKNLTALVVLAYSLIALAMFILGIGGRPEVKWTKPSKASITLLFIMKYPFLYRHASKLKIKVHNLTERAGINIYELELVAKYMTYAIWVAMSLPTVYLILSTLLPFPMSLFIALGVTSAPLIIYYTPFMMLRAKIAERKSGVEREYPVFLAYAATMISAGMTFYSVFKDLATERGRRLFKAFHKEAKYFINLVERQGLPELRALDKYASTHPSAEMRNLINQYLHERTIGGRVSRLMEDKLHEALSLLTRRLERYVNNIMLMAELALIILVFPSAPMIIGFMISPGVVQSMVYAELFGFVPLTGLLFMFAAKAMSLSFDDEYPMSYIYSVIGGVASLVVALFIAPKNVVAGVAIVIAGIAFGNYIEYYRLRRQYQLIESIMPRLFRDLTELRQMMTITDALERLSKMHYPKQIARLLRKMVMLRKQGVKLIDQEWHSRSWFWRFAQFLLGKIEETGGGTQQLFRMLTEFFTEFNTIMSSARAQLRIYEVMIYASPLIFALITYSTLGIFTSMSSVVQTSGAMQQVMSGSINLPISGGLSNLLRFMRGIPPEIMVINDVTLLEMGLILGIIGGRIIAGTVRNTRILAISMIIVAVALIVAPQMISNLIASSVPK